MCHQWDFLAAYVRIQGAPELVLLPEAPHLVPSFLNNFRFHGALVTAAATMVPGALNIPLSYGRHNMLPSMMP